MIEYRIGHTRNSKGNFVMHTFEHRVAMEATAR